MARPIIKGFAKPKIIQEPSPEAIDEFVNKAQVGTSFSDEEKPSKEENISTKKGRGPIAVRRTYSMTNSDVLLMEALQKKANIAYTGERMIGKSEILRAGLVALDKISPQELVALLDQVEVL
jgi:hypothetical protein